MIFGQVKLNKDGLLRTNVFAACQWGICVRSFNFDDKK